MKKSSIQILTVIIIVFTFIPQITYAQAFCSERFSRSATVSPSTPQNLSDFVCVFVDIISSLVPVVIALTLLIFLWGLARFILAAGDEKKIEAGRSLMFWGVIGLFVMVSVWGILTILSTTVFGGTLISTPLLPS